MKTTSDKSPSVGIIGCGWLGFPLAVNLIKTGLRVEGTTTSPEKIALFETANINAHIFNAGLDDFPKPLLDLNVLVVAFPPKSKSTNGEWYSQAMQGIAGQIQGSKIEKVILISSTSVYPEVEEILREDFKLNKLNTGNPGLLKAEDSILEIPISTFVLRFGGLTGGNRLLAKHFAGKSGLKNGSSQ